MDWLLGGMKNWLVASVLRCLIVWRLTRLCHVNNSSQFANAQGVHSLAYFNSGVHNSATRVPTASTDLLQQLCLHGIGALPASPGNSTSGRAEALIAASPTAPPHRSFGDATHRLKLKPPTYGNFPPLRNGKYKFTAYMGLKDTFSNQTCHNVQ